MDSIFNLIFLVVEKMVANARLLEFTALGFTVNIFDFFLGLFVLGSLLPILFVMTDHYSGRVGGLISNAVSERIRRK